jgi:hypothetical protein
MTLPAIKRGLRVARKVSRKPKRLRLVRPHTRRTLNGEVSVVETHTRRQ